MISLGELFVSSGVMVHPDQLQCLNEKVLALTSDSRAVRKGSVFFALKGFEQDGHRFVQDAMDKGCIAVVVDREIDRLGKTAVIRVKDTQDAYGRMAAAFYNFPARAMSVIGLTGTNGKTTTSWIIEEMLKSRGYAPGVIGTVNYRYTARNGKTVVREASLTTPESATLQRLLREMADAGVSHVIIEVSSHALDQQRLVGMNLDIGVFTNLSRDHLDYHKTMDAYFSSKQRLFRELLKPGGTAVVVIDPEKKNHPSSQADWGGILVDNLARQGFVRFPGRGERKMYISCGLNRECTVRAEVLEQDINGFSCMVSVGGRSLRLKSELIGRHNIQNMLAASGVGLALGMESQEIVHGLSRVHSVPGRLERIVLPACGQDASGPVVFVDYAHTPDALENVLRTLRPVTAGFLYCIVGCGGNRDKGKRPMMGAVAGRIADRILVTSDNPRNENPYTILEEIETGLLRTGIKKVDYKELCTTGKSGKAYAVIEDRREAIHTVCAWAGKGDVVLIAGKGHETYQLTQAGKRFFDDRVEAKNGRVRWHAEHLLRATSGKLEAGGEKRLFGKISTDTRTLNANDIFLALQGDNFDGHDFVVKAVEKGAGAVLVSRPVPHLKKNVTVIRVENTLRALGDLACYRRQALAPEIRVIGITGSSGKTTVKEMTAAIFEEQDKSSGQDTVLKTRGNLNNLVGLPLSLLQVNAGHRTAVMEMGMNRPGEIERLAGIADPDIGCITNVQAAHLEGLGSIEGVARAKGELFTAMSARGIRVINCDDPHIRKLGGENGNNVIGFAVTPVGRRLQPEVRATRIISLGEVGMRFTLHINKWRKRFTTPATGTHNVSNCSAAAAIATAAGLDPEIIVQGLARFKSYDKRMEISGLPGEINVVNDAYNANPSSMKAALKTVATFGRNCRRAVALGDMFELGEGARQAHRMIGSLVAELGYDFMAVTGDFAAEVAESAERSGMERSRVMVCKDTGAVADWLAHLVAGGKIQQGDWLLIKGSRSMRMERVLEYLQEQLSKKN